MLMSAPPEDWSAWVGQLVILDTDSSVVFIGTLQEVTPGFVRLVNVDVHDIHETPTTKERYILDARRFGVNANRKEASVRREKVVSLSRLEDVIVY